MAEDIIEEMKKNALLISDSRTDEILKMDEEFIKKYFGAGLVIFGMVSFLMTGLTTRAGIVSILIAVAFTLVYFAVFAAAVAFVVDKILHKEDRKFTDELKILVVGYTPVYLFGAIPLIGFIAGLATLANVVLVTAKAYREELVKTALVYLLVLIVVGLLASVFYRSTLFQIAGY